MAIQIPNPGTGNGATGDNEFVLWSKVKDNFSDQTNAASRLVGTSVGQIPLASKARLAASKPDISRATVEDVNSLVGTDMTMVTSGTPNAPTYITGNSAHFVESLQIEGAQRVWQFAYASHLPEIQMRMRLSAGGGFGAWARLYHTGNTKLDTNGAIAPSSPTIDLYSDGIETNSDGARMNPEFVRNGVGDYTIKNTTGLSDEGWYIKIPNDMNGNPKVAVVIDTDKDGNLSVKTYRRIFSMETFIFIPDLETPLDIPEGRWIDLRFNDLPIEAQEELPTDGG